MAVRLRPSMRGFILSIGTMGFLLLGWQNCAKAPFEGASNSSESQSLSSEQVSLGRACREDGSIYLDGQERWLPTTQRTDKVNCSESGSVELVYDILVREVCDDGQFSGTFDAREVLIEERNLSCQGERQDGVSLPPEEENEPNMGGPQAKCGNYNHGDKYYKDTDNIMSESTQCARGVFRKNKYYQNAGAVPKTFEKTYVQQREYQCNNGSEVVTGQTRPGDALSGANLKCASNSQCIPSTANNMIMWIGYFGNKGDMQALSVSNMAFCGNNGRWIVMQMHNDENRGQ